MEKQHDTLSNHELRQLWTRFEGLVGHQLHRLQEDGSNGVKTSPNKHSSPVSPRRQSTQSTPKKAASSVGDCNSSMFSEIVSNASSSPAATSPARLPLKQQQGDQEHKPPSAGESNVDGYYNEVDYVNCSVSGVGGSSDGAVDDEDTKVSRRESCGSEKHSVVGGILGSPVDGCVQMNFVNIDDRSSCVDGDAYYGVVEEKVPEKEGGYGDGVGVDTSLSSCLVPSCGSSSASHMYNGVKRNASANAINSCESQPLYGLPYVARAAGPLLSLLNVTLDEWEGKNGPLAGTLLRLKDKRKESKRNMLGVYKQSLLLESQLHQYLNPGLVLSLNRRVARATFDAEMMAKLIDRLKREASRAVEDPRRISKVMEVSSKIESLIGRQKCEWQCVGRLKETLTMAKEMKDLLRFIARLSNTLEKSKSAFGGLHDRPPPYDYCSPYSGITKTLSQEAENRGKSDKSDTKQKIVCDPHNAKEEKVWPSLTLKELRNSPGRYSSSRAATSRSEMSVSGRSGVSGDSRDDVFGKRADDRGQSLKGQEFSRIRSLTPKRCTRSPGPRRSKSTNFEPDSYSSFKGSNIISKSPAKDEFSENSNVSTNPIVCNLPTITLREGKCVGSEWTSPNGDDRILDFKNNKLCCAAYDNQIEDPTRNERTPGMGEQNNSGGNGCASHLSDCRVVACKALKSGSPPRARHKDDPCYKPPRREVCGDDHGKKKQSPPNTRWDNSHHRSRVKLSHLEGPVEASDSNDSLTKSSVKSTHEEEPSYNSFSKDSETLKTKPSRDGKSKSALASPQGIKSPKKEVKSEEEIGDGDKDEEEEEEEEESECVTQPEDSCCSSVPSCGCNCRDRSGASKCGSICIDIESEYKNKGCQPASCPPGCRRIRVKVNKRSSSDSPAKKEESAPKIKEESVSKSKTESLQMSKTESLQKSKTESLSMEKEEVVEEDVRPLPEGSSQSEIPSQVMESKMSDAGPAQAVLTGEPPPSPTPPAQSVVQSSTASKIQNQVSRPASSQQQPSSANEGDDGHNNVPLPDISAYHIPGIGKLDQPWKLLLAGLLLLALLYFLLSLLSGKCCGCGYFPNPLFFLTNSLAGRVTLRHHGLAPT